MPELPDLVVYVESLQARVLADRSLSRLLRDDWPRNLAELSVSQKAASLIHRADSPDVGPVEPYAAVLLLICKKHPVHLLNEIAA